MAFFPTNAAQVQTFATALYGVQVGSTTMTQVTSDIQAAGGLNNALNAYYSASFGTASVNDVAKAIVANVGLGADTNAIAFIAAQLTPVAAGARGAAVIAMLDNFLNTTTGTYAAAATAFNATVATAVAYTGAANVAAGTANPVIASVFTLGTSVDTITATAGDDTISATNLTLQSGDALFGGSGADTLNIIDTGAAAWTVPVIANSYIETVSLRNINSSAAVAAVTEKSKISFQNIGANETIVINGLTVTAGGSGGNAADIAAALVAHSGSTR